MSPKQRVKFFAELWPAACQAQGWDEANREVRLRFLSDVLGRTVESINEVNQTAEFDAVKARCLRLVDDVAGALEDGEPAVGEKRRLLFKIQALRVPAAYLQVILKERFKTDAIEALQNWQLLQLIATLNSRSRKFRNPVMGYFDFSHES